MNKQFVSLHTHTSYSQLDGASKIPELVDRAVELGMNSLGVSDHGNLNGLIDFYRECKKKEIKPVLGQEFYFSDDRLVKEVVKQENENGEIDGSDKRYYHLSIWAENNEGYQNLIKLSSDAFLNGMYYKPRTDYSMLEDHSEGIMVGSGCLGGPVLQKLLHGDFNGALLVAGHLQDIVGKENFFIEMMNHGLAEQRRTNPMLIDLAKQIEAPLICTQDTHYTHQHDSKHHDVLLCQPPGTMVEMVERGSSKGLSRGEFVPNRYYLKPIEDILEGDIVRSWNPINRRGRIRNSGSTVTRVASREYKDNLVVVKSNEKTSKYTKDHICAVRLDADLDEGNYIVYLMEDWNGKSFRIGLTEYRKTYSNHTLGPIVRCKEEDAKSVWILGVYNTLEEARKFEAYKSWKYNIPTWSFGHPIKDAHQPRTHYFPELWESLGDLRSNANRCLVDHNKLIDYPLWNRRETQPSQRTPIFIRACNIESGMLVCIPGEDSYEASKANTNDGSQAWQPAFRNYEPYEGLVYSMDVEIDQTYIADGIVTHNCCQTGSKMSDPKRFKFHNDQYYLKSAQEMRSLFSDTIEACDNTLLIAERANVEIDFDTLHLPKFPVPEGYDSDYDFLEHLTMEGLKLRYDNPSQEVYERAAYELSVIKSMNLSSYFLIFWDLVKFADKERIFTGPGRGSAAGCIVSYALRITKLDPIKHGLIFERFINPDRIALADIDWDIDTRYREKMINYTREKYGEDHVAQIITFNTIKARTAVRDSARVLGYDWSVGDKIAKAMPPLIMGVDTPLYACFKEEAKHESGFKNAQELRDMYNTDPQVREVIDAAMGIEGLVRQDGIHAAAVVIGDQPLSELIPLQRRANKPITTQYGKDIVEDLGLLKMDFLGLRNLDVISDTLQRLKLPFDYLESISLDDPEVYSMLQRGEGIAVFQVESPQMRDLLERLRPTSIDDISAVLALYRPGPMAMNMHYDYADRKNGLQPAKSFHEVAKDILSETYQLAIYQEQVMEISKEFAGYTMAEADNLRKIMGKKLPEKMAAEKSKFVSGCIENGYEPAFSSDLFQMIEGFASYGFNKAHSMGYGYITYWTAYLKAHHPKEYMASLCSSVMSDMDKSAVYLNETRRLGLKVYPPDLNTSQTIYTVEEDGIRIGLNAMKNLGEGATNNLIAERQAHGEFTSLYDFAKRFNPNVQAFKSLAYSGALDTFGTRQGIAAIADDILKATRKEAKKISKDQTSLFNVESVVEFNIPETEFSEMELLKMEKDTLGIYVSGHPLDSFPDRKTKYNISDIKEMEDSKTVYNVLCMVSDINIKYTKKGDAMATIAVEDQTGSLDVVVFPRSFSEFKSQLFKDGISFVKLRVGRDYRDQKNYVLVECTTIDNQQRESVDQIFGIYLPKKFHLDTKYMSKLKGIVLSHAGKYPMRLYTSRSAVLKLNNEYFVDPDGQLKRDVAHLFQEYNQEKKGSKNG